MVRTRYQVDLSAHLADCEMNYLRLQKLLPPDIAVGDSLNFELEGGAMQFTVVECAPYTTLLDLFLSRDSTGHWLNTALRLRVYHDAAVAEVVGRPNSLPVRPRYKYPNRGMHQRDEKAQLNAYLGEWLSRCLQSGHRSETVPLNSFET